MEGIISLGALAAASAGLLATKYLSKKEGFDSPFPETTQNLVNEQSTRFNPLMNLIMPTRNSLLTPDFSAGELQTAQTNARNALRDTKAYPEDPSFRIDSRSVANYKLNPEKEGSVFYNLKKCEAIKTATCSAFDDPQFAATCGICFEDGVDSQNDAKLGGLYVTQDSKDAAKTEAARLKTKYPNYIPTLGSCKPGRFVTTKEECLRLERKIECEKKQNFSAPGCSQCYQDTKFYYIDPSVERDVTTINVVGQGVARFTTGNMGQPVQVQLSSTPQVANLPSLEEGDTVQISVEGSSSYIAGFISGETPSGKFVMDISKIIHVDTKTGIRPRITGSVTINNTPYMIIRPGKMMTGMNLVFMNPFSFLRSDEEEAALCAAGPFITKEASSQLLNSSPCYVKGQGPGNYSQDCLKTLYEASGCSASGTLYPGSEEAAQKLQYGPNGQPREIGGIGDLLYTIYNYATTGKDNGGQPLAIDEWNQASMGCLGKQVTSPCDMYNKDTGPLGVDCLSYLWQNAGEKQTIAGGVTNTYTGSQNIASLSGSTNTYCRTTGTMAPVGADGKENPQAIQTAQSKGGVANVKAFYDSISRNANDNSLTDQQRGEAIRQCYGISLQDTVQQQTATAQAVQRASLLDSRSGSVQTPFLQQPAIVSQPGSITLDLSSWTRTGGVTNPTADSVQSPSWNPSFNFGAYLKSQFTTPFYLSFKPNDNTYTVIGFTANPNVNSYENMDVAFAGGTGTVGILFKGNMVHQIYGVSTNTVLSIVYDPNLKSVRFYRDYVEFTPSYRSPVSLPLYLQVLFGAGSIRNIQVGDATLFPARR